MTEADIPKYFNGAPQNIGVLLGEASNGLIDCDLDCPQALALADSMLPKTQAVFGRKSTPQAHRLYRCAAIERTQQFKDIDGSMLVELRGTGGQTVFPPSVHPQGERIEWHEYGEPLEIEKHELLRGVERLAAASLLARHWPGTGSREETALALAGLLLRSGHTPEAAAHFVRAVARAAMDEEADKRAAAVWSTQERINRGDPATGRTRLEQLLGEPVVARARKWLRLGNDAGSLGLSDASAEGGTKPPAARARRIPNYIPFPTHLLPLPVRDFVVRCSDAIGCDPAFVALPALAAAASAIGNTRRVRLKQGWSEPAIIWAVPIAISGKQKTPAFGVILRVIDELQRRSLQEHAEAMKRHEAKLDAYEVRRRKWIKDGGEGEPPTKPEEPIPDRLYCSDTTIEALAMLLFNHWRGILLLRDELSGWFSSFDQYHQGKGSDVAYWLETHGGRPILIDRKTGKPKTIHVPRAAVSITGCIQPRVLGRILGGKYFENGLAARFLLAYPPKRPRRWTEADIPHECEEEMLRLFERLYELREDTSRDSEPIPREIDLTPEAKRAWIEFYNKHGEEQDAMTGDLSAAWSKLEGYAARLALVVNYLRWAGGSAEADPCVDEASIRAGIELSKWFGNEAKRVYAILQESEEEQQDRELVELIRAKGGEVTVRAWQRLRSTPTAEAAEEELQGLVDRGHGSWVHSTPLPQGGRPTKVFRLHTEAPDNETPRDDAPPGVSSVSGPEVCSRDAQSETGGEGNDQSPGGPNEPHCTDDPPLTSDRTPRGGSGMGVSPEGRPGPRLQGNGSGPQRPSPEPAASPDTDRTPPGVPPAGVSDPPSIVDLAIETFDGTIIADNSPTPSPPAQPKRPPDTGQLFRDEDSASWGTHDA